MRILITDFYCTYNCGDAAILEGMIYSLRKAFDQPEIVVTSSWPRAAERRHSIVAVPPLVTLPTSGGSMFTRLGVRGTWRLKLATLRWAARYGTSKITDAVMTLAPGTYHEYQRADLILSCGGGFLNDNYYLGLIRRLYGLLVAKRLKKPVMIYAQSIGPFRRAPYVELARAVLNHVDAITTRDSLSLEVLKDIGVVSPLVEFTADAAFSLPPAGEENGVAIPSRWTIQKGDAPVMGISVRRWQYPGAVAPEKKHRRYIHEIAKVADYLTSEYEARLIFVPMALGEEGYHADDRKVAHQVMQCMEQKKAASVLDDVLMPWQMREVLGNLDLLLATRMHALILATTMYVPSVGISYEFKIDEYMNRIGQGELVCDIQTLSHEELVSKIDNAWRHRWDIREALKRRIPILVRRSHRNATIAKELVSTFCHP